MFDVLQGFINAVKADGRLTSALTGFFTDEEPESGVMPYGVLTSGGAGGVDYDTSKTFTQDVTLTVTLYARSLSEMQGTVKAFRDRFNLSSQGLVMPSGRVLQVQITSETWRNGRVPDNEKLSRKEYDLEFEFLQQQERQ